jgi:hypothetical protein
VTKRATKRKKSSSLVLRAIVAPRAIVEDGVTVEDIQTLFRCYSEAKRVIGKVVTASRRKA